MRLKSRIQAFCDRKIKSCVFLELIWFTSSERKASEARLDCNEVNQINERKTLDRIVTFEQLN